MVMRSDGAAYVQKEGNHDFHYYIFSRCKNEWLVNCITNNIYYLIRMCRLNLSHRTPSRPQLALKEHNGIVDAIENRDADLVEMLMRRHIDTAWKALEKIIGGDAMPEGELIPDKRVGSGLV
jgi:DNA-binding GntR family transcriptional regulator